MVPFDRFAVVLDACTMFPMLVRDVLLTFAAHEFFSPKWSPRIREEWTHNLVARMADRDGQEIARTKVARISAAVETAFPDALVATELPESPVLDPVDAKTDTATTRGRPRTNIPMVEHERRGGATLRSSPGIYLIAPPLRSPRLVTLGSAPKAPRKAQC